MKILILKPSSLGDIIQALPVLRMLKLRHPDAQVYWWVSSEFAPLLEDDPDLKGLFHFHRKRWANPVYWDEMIESIRAMRIERFDYTLDLQSLARSAVFGWLANAQTLITLDDSREAAPSFADVAVPRPSQNTHAVDWYLQVLHKLDVPIRWDFQWLPIRQQAVQAICSRWPETAEGHPWILLQPGARWENKRWPIEHFIQLTRSFAQKHPEARIGIMGGASDQALGAAIASASPGRCVDLTGKTSLLEMVEWVRLCRVLITNDTGPMHVAAALGKPIVAMFGPTNPSRTGPYGQMAGVLRTPLPCVPCMSSTCSNELPIECLTSISSQVVFERASALLQNNPARVENGIPTRLE